MRHFGMVVAILRELNSFLEDNSFKVTTLKYNNHIVYKTMINHDELYIINSGCGEIDASSATQLLISKFDCELILNYGVVGALKRNMSVEDLYVVEKVVHYDFDVSSIDNVKPSQYAEFNDVYMPTTKKYIDLVKKIDGSIKEVICASGDKFIADKTIKENLARKYNASICDMESAAIIRTAYKNKVDVLSIKCISDTFDGDGKDFNKNVTKSSKKAFNIIKELIYKL